VETRLVFVDSAFKHGIPKADILWAFETARFDGLIQGYDNKHLLLSSATKGTCWKLCIMRLRIMLKRYFTPCRAEAPFNTC
jgi:hypothetical protein